ncbi:MAG: vanadium-dependent haloperoxidase [Gemmobacter sp.]|uniref:vanadium-dependent haloperoxidase n=1 Tax=Gemmobacter sp. TaxID=1898957 RepID=UPI001A4F508E|nr:vanadium-dependent haloperoxidase [Gemmobacter sp.]MBL8561820.1 vanadium-dependent haloperoxidase [Gemmobacter sp.]
MDLRRRHFLTLAAAALSAPALPARASADPACKVVLDWYRLVLELVRHTATYSPPVAARAFGYLGVIVWEAQAHASGFTPLGGQLNGLKPLPQDRMLRDPAAVLHGAMTLGVRKLFGNTGPTGQRAMDAMEKRLDALVKASPSDLEKGRAVAAHILDWAATDGGAQVKNLGFPDAYDPSTQPGAWAPTSPIRLQQAPLLPDWGQVRPMAMAHGAACTLPPPPDFSTEPGSAFHAQAMEVYTTVKSLTPEQKAIARFWSDDPMLSPTPPGHWISILLGIAARDALPLPRLADALARLGVAQMDAFIACWQAKFTYNLIRPVSYIRKHIDKTWEPLLITPPFPEYPSGHSTLSGASAAVLTAIFGAGFAFDDATHEDDGLPPRHFADFAAAAQEAALSRLYGGIHFRAAIEQGLAQGECVASSAIRLKTL